MPPRFLSLPELLEVRASGCAQDVAGVGSSRNLGELIYNRRFLAVKIIYYWRFLAGKIIYTLEVSSWENHL
jgi:hypothetical protein